MLGAGSKVNRDERGGGPSGELARHQRLELSVMELLKYPLVLPPGFLSFCQLTFHSPYEAPPILSLDYNHIFRHSGLLGLVASLLSSYIYHWHRLAIQLDVRNGKQSSILERNNLISQAGNLARERHYNTRTHW